jgi:hypothetical protein
LLAALYANTFGGNNTAAGALALGANTTGNNNITEGFQAGYNLTTGSNNINIGNVGVAAESYTIRIDTKGTQKARMIEGIYDTPVNGAAVVVSSTGRLGVTVSSEPYKGSQLSDTGCTTDAPRQGCVCRSVLMRGFNKPGETSRSIAKGGPARMTVEAAAPVPLPKHAAARDLGPIADRFAGFRDDEQMHFAG